MSRTFKIYLPNFQTYSIVLLTVVTMLSITSRTYSSCSDKFVTLCPSSLSPDLPHLPLATSSLLSISLGILDSAYEWDHTVFFFVWVILLIMMPSSFIHTVANSKIFLFFIAGFYFSVCLCITSHHIFLCPFIHLWTLRLFPCLDYSR